MDRKDMSSVILQLIAASHNLIKYRYDRYPKFLGSVIFLFNGK